MKKQWSIVLLIALILLVVIFSVMNVDPVAINFGFNIIQVPLVLVIIVTLLLGVLIAVILSTTIILQNKNEQKKLNRRLTEIEDEKKREKDELNELHKKEVETLKEEKEEDQIKIRELERRIQNIQTTNIAHDKNQEF
jgi:uncharacterized integral membrane protein